MQVKAEVCEKLEKEGLLSETEVGQRMVNNNMREMTDREYELEMKRLEMQEKEKEREMQEKEKEREMQERERKEEREIQRQRGKGACERSGSIVSYRSLLHETAI